MEGDSRAGGEEMGTFGSVTFAPNTMKQAGPCVRKVESESMDSESVCSGLGFRNLMSHSQRSRLCPLCHSALTGVNSKGPTKGPAARAPGG